MTTDRMLGSTWIFFHCGPRRTVRHRVEVVAYDPERGWKLVGAGFAAAWVPKLMWHMLLNEGVLVPR